jgi:hypothetical protein
LRDGSKAYSSGTAGKTKLKAYENARASMIAGIYGTVTSEEAQPLLADIGPVQTCILDLSSHLENLDRLIAVQSDKPGFAQEKSQKLSELAQLAAEVCGATLAYAEQSGNERLAAKLNIPFTKLSSGKDSKIISHCRNIHKAASSVADSLGEFKVTPAKLKALKQKTDDYKTLSTKSREARAARKAATGRIPVVIRQAVRLLRKRLDPLMVPFKASNPEFYAQYKAARRIVKPGSADAKKKIANVSQPTSVPKAA